MAALAVRAQCGLQREVGENVAVKNDEGLVAEQVAHIPDAARGFEDVGKFVAEIQFRRAVVFVREKLRVALGLPVRVHDEAVDPRAGQALEGVGNERAVDHGDERLWAAQGHRAQAGAEAGAEDESGADG